MISIDDLPELKYEDSPALTPKMDDLNRLYDLIVNNFCVTVLEFGCGYSTFVMVKALEANKARWEALDNKPPVRNSKMFKCYSVDTNKKWIDEVKNKLDNKTASFLWSYAYTGLYQGRLCSYYKTLPDVVPDFVYLDGPDPNAIRTNQNVNYLSWKCPERTPIAADILLMEPTFIPGTIIYVDGRTNNARFLENNLQREWMYSHRQNDDCTIMVLDEPRLGKINVIGRDILEAIQ